MSNQAILGGDAVDGNPDVVVQAANRLRAAETRARAVSDQLDGSRLQHVWSGGASQAFQAVVDDLPGELSKVVSSCSVARSTLDTYATRLRDAKTRADALAAEADHADRGVNVATQRVAGAQATVRRSRAQLAAATTSEARLQIQRTLAHDQTALADATRTRSAAQGNAASVRARARSNRQTFEEAATSCINGLTTASDLGMKSDLFTYYERHVAPAAIGAIRVATTVGRGFVQAVEAVVGFVTDTIVDAATLQWNLAAFLLNPSSSNFDKLMDSIDATLTIAAIVVAVAAGIVLAPATAAVLGAAIFGLGIVAGATRLGVHGVEVAADHRDPDILVWDAIGVLLSAVRAPSARDLFKAPTLKGELRDHAFDDSASFIAGEGEKQFVGKPSDAPWLYTAPGANLVEDIRDQMVQDEKDVLRVILMPKPVAIFDQHVKVYEGLLDDQELTLDPRVIEGSRR